MGKLIVTEFMTLDGVAQAPGEPDEDRDRGFTHGGWQVPLLDQESGRAMFETAGVPTYDNLAIEDDDLQRLTGGDERARP